MQVILFHPNADVICETEKILTRCSDMTALCASYEELYESGLACEGMVVSPGNGFGIMDGGFDRVLRDVHGIELEHRIKRAIIRMYGPEIPVGCAVSSAAADGQYVIYAPTMQVPMDIACTDNVYRAARAASHLAKMLHVETLWMPLMGTGAGSLPLDEAVWQMAAGVIDGTAELSAEEMNWEHADRIHLQWHRFCKVPDDGVRFAELMKEAQKHGDIVEDQADSRS